MQEKEVQLSEVQSEMTALQGEVRTLREEKGGLQHDNETLREEKSGLQSDNETHISEVKRLQVCMSASYIKIFYLLMSLHVQGNEKEWSKERTALQQENKILNTENKGLQVE